MPTYEGFRLRILNIISKTFANYRNGKLINKNFTIISNNCWGGRMYECYNLQKQSPTIGLYMFSSDYIEFITHFKEYVSAPLEFVTSENSKWKEKYKEINNDQFFGKYPIGKLSYNGNTVEIMFLHYKSNEEAKEKWDRRCKRINWDNLIFKFDDQNGCTKIDVQNFVNLPYKKKLFFTCKKWGNINLNANNTRSFVIKQFTKEPYITVSHQPFGRVITKFINK